MAFYTLKVANIIKETVDTVTICFRQPSLKKIKYLPGQYLTLIFRINGRRYIRPYSFSSSPGVDDLLEVTIKRVPGGLVSNHINDEIKINDSIEVMQPMGDFIYDENEVDVNHIVLWGAGSGITPLMSIAKYALAKNPSKKVTLIYGNRDHESVIFREKIHELSVQYPHSFTIWHFHTRLVVDEKNPYLVQGRINPEKFLSISKRENITHAIHYICGPLGLKESVKQALNTAGVANEYIKTEDFELVRDPKDFEDITTQKIKIDFNGQATTLEVVKGKSILEAGLDALLELPYSCQTGNCITCKGKVISGAVKTIGIDKFPAGLEQDEYLLCCSHPLTEDVQIIV